MKYDLHVHSKYSDGNYTLSELCVLARENGLSGFALTDHDTIAGWREIPEVMKTYDIKVIPAIEISTEEDNRDVHILAYGLRGEIPHITSLLTRLRQSRINRIYDMVANLSKAGVQIKADEVFDVAGDASPGRPHVAKVLLSHGYAKSIYGAFNKYLGKDCPGYAPREKLLPNECISTILADGGLPVLAHPGLDDVFELMPQLVACGLRGIEVYHSSHSPGQERKFKALAETYSLRITGGSDFHGYNDGKHGNIGSSFIICDNIDEYLTLDGGK